MFEILGGSPACLYTGADPRAELLLVPGQQLACSKGLEVLAVGSGERIEEGLSIGATVTEVLRHRGLCIVPWGFGKWWFQRGELVREILRSNDLPETFFLGDTRWRALPAPAPPLLREAEDQGIGILSGTDPLPFRWQQRVVGSYGCWIEGALNRDDPFPNVVELLQRGTPHRTIFGRTARLAASAVHQVLMQFQKRLRGRTRS